MKKTKKRSSINLIVMIAVFLMLCMTIGVISISFSQEIAFASGEAGADAYQSIALTPDSFNKDVIANGETTLVEGKFNTIDHYVDGDENQYCYNTFYSSDFSYNGKIPATDTGFPANNIIVGDYSNANYSIAAYSGNNVAYVSNGSQQTLTFASSGAYDDLVFLSTRAGTGAGVSTLNVSINFSDGTTTEMDKHFSIQNWFENEDDHSNGVYLGYALQGRVQAGGPNVGTIQRNPGAPYLKECYMSLSDYKSKLVESVTIKSESSEDAGCYVFAIAGKKAAATLGTPVQTAITNISTTKLTANWNNVIGSTGYAIDVATNESFDSASMVPGFNNKSLGKVTNAVVFGLTSATQYFVRVRAVNESGQGFSSNVMSAATNEGPTLLVTFNQQYLDAPAYPAQNVGTGTQATYPTDPTRPKHIFDGWYEEAACTNLFDFETVITENITLYAKWLPAYEITFNLQYDTNPPTFIQKVEPNTPTTAPSTLKREGHVFDGWYEEAACTNLFDFNTNITADTTLYAKWSKEQYVLVLDSIGGEGTVNNVTVEYGQSTAGIFPELTKYGHIVVEWECGQQILWGRSYYGEENEYFIDDLGNDNAEINAWAVWGKKYYTLHYNPNGGTCKDRDWKSYGSTVALPEAVKEGNTFVGWYTKDGSIDNDWGNMFGYYIDDLGAYGTTIELYARYTQGATFAITGKAIDKNGNPVNEAMIMLKAGSNVYATMSTNTLGEFEIKGLTAKLYQLVMVKSGLIVTKTIDLKESLADFSVTLPDSELISIVEVEENVPEVVIDGLNETFSSADQTTASEPGKKVELKMIVKNAAVTSAAINNNLGGFTLAISLDISIVKTNYSDGIVVSSDAVSTTGGLIKIILPLSTELQGKYEYSVLREHGSNIQRLTTQANADGEYIEVSADKTTLTLYVKNFSQYAITYMDTAPSNGNLPGGAIAGIVIGIIILLLLIAFVVLYVLWKKRNVKPLACLVPVFRKLNNLLFKTTFNDVEIKQNLDSEITSKEQNADDSAISEEEDDNK